MLHRTRHLFIRQQTSVINAIRAHLAEFGVIAPVGRKGIEELLRVIADQSDKRLPDVVASVENGLTRDIRVVRVFETPARPHWVDWVDARPFNRTRLSDLPFQAASNSRL